MTYQLTLTDYFTGPGRVRRDSVYAASLTGEIKAAARHLTTAVNSILAHLLADGIALQIHPGTGTLLSSGWRPPAVNAKTKGAAKMSAHMTGEALDLYDPTWKIAEWCHSHLAVLEALGLYLEHPSATVGWCHLQTRPPKSGRRVFYP